MGRLSGKVAVITGANSGIGLATAREFVDEGAHVFIVGRRKAELDRAVSSIGHNVTAIVGDVTKLADLDLLVATIEEQKGRIDVLFANAGMLPAPAAVGAVTEEEYDATFDVNVKGLFFTVQKLLPLIADGAAILLCASAVTIKGYPSYSVYSASKAAVRSFARTLAADLKTRKIRVNAISPGQIDTAMLSDGKTPEQVSQAKDFFASIIPLGRVGRPGEVAKTAAFLASEDSSYITGTELFVDGGVSQV